LPIDRMNYRVLHSRAMILVTKWFGVFLCEEGQVRKQHLFDKDPELIAQKLALVQRGEILPEERAMAGKGMKVSDPRLSELGRPVYFDSSFIKAEDFACSKDLMHEVMVHLGKLRSREPVSRDRCVLQAIRAVDDLVEMINLMSERLHEWYGLHFPELADQAKEEVYARLIADLGKREEIIREVELDLESVGSDMVEGDIEVIRELAGELVRLYQLKQSMEGYVAEMMREVAPNISTLLNPNLGARLISLAGGLKRLSALPSSTVQLLGAEKALFLHLKSNKKPPKHGIIFQHPWVHRAPYWQRGKISRTLASKIAIAAKLDYWGGEFEGDRLVREMERRVEEIGKKYPTPPKKRVRGKR